MAPLVGTITYPGKGTSFSQLPFQRGSASFMECNSLGGGDGPIHTWRIGTQDLFQWLINHELIFRYYLSFREFDTCNGQFSGIILFSGRLINVIILVVVTIQPKLWPQPGTLVPTLWLDDGLQARHSWHIKIEGYGNPSWQPFFLKELRLY